ncbi:hypothetical protein BDC45DRAFT_44114 [Circinella umbellata]|nr:hypothetical protein BDC45DRAFT_44114 [Circinella umbellata]
MPKEYNLRKRKTPVQYNEEEIQVTKRPRKQSTKSTPRKQKATITVNPNQQDRSNHSNKSQKKVTKRQPNPRGVILDRNVSPTEEETTIQQNDSTESPQSEITDNRQSVKLDFNNILPDEQEKEARILQSEQSPDKENEGEEEVEEQIDDVLNALLELHHLDDPPRVDTLEGSNVAIAEALRLNREMQNEAIGQIAWIKQRILQNEALMVRKCFNYLF